MDFKDAHGNKIVPGDTVLIPGFFLATMVEHDPKVYGTDKPMVQVHNGPRDLIFYHADELAKVRVTPKGRVTLIGQRSQLERPAFD